MSTYPAYQPRVNNPYGAQPPQQQSSFKNAAYSGDGGATKPPPHEAVYPGNGGMPVDKAEAKKQALASGERKPGKTVNAPSSSPPASRRSKAAAATTHHVSDDEGSRSRRQKDEYVWID